MTELTNKIRQRGTLRRRMTFFESSIQSQFPDGAEPSKEGIFQLHSRLEKFRVILDEFDKIQDEIEEFTDNLENEYKYRQEFENDYYDLVGKAQSLIDLYERNTFRSEVPSNGSESGGSVRSLQDALENITQSSLLNTVRLPTIELLKFLLGYIAAT